MFHFIYKIIILRLNKEKDDIEVRLYFFRSLNCKFEAAYRSRYFMRHSAMKTHLLTNQKAHTIQIIL